MTRAQPDSFLKPKLLAVSVAACFALNAGLLRANPSGPTVAHGSVGFSGLGTSALTITNQAGGNAIINWNGFSIGINELTKFQQFANLAVLNRVTGGQISSILGSLQSDGRVFLINPNGIVFGASARIDVAGMVASSLNLSDQDFLSNRLRFTEVPGAGAVVNNGVIETATGGRVYLVAPTVENNGLIQAKQGEILLAAGKEVELVDGAAPYVTIKVTAGSESALNIGNLVAEGGRIGMFGALVRNSGTIEAGGAMAGPGGEIRLVATKDLTLDAGSLVAANGTSGGKVLLQAEGGTNLVGGTVEAKGSAGKGGEISALGVRVGVVGHGLIDASGDTGGGTVLVGGDYQGKNAGVQNAERTYIGTDGVIRADAMTTGDGGRVIVWADGDTRFFGSISAKGGSQSGNGGFVETSGKEALQAFGSVNTSAANGQGGTWLLDPNNINIVANNGSVGDDDQVSSYGILPFDWNPPSTSVVGTNSILGAMIGGNDVILQATNDINLQTSVDTSAYGGRSLTLTAGNDIGLNFYDITTGADLTLSAGNAITSSTSGSALTSVNGSVTLAGPVVGGALDISAATGIVTGAISAESYNSRVTMTTTGGSITTGSINTSEANDGSSAVTLTASYGSIAVNGNITTGGDGITLTAGLNVTTGALNTSNKGDTQSGYYYGNGNIVVSAGNGILTGPITTRSLHPSLGDGGEVSLSTNTGSITVNGNIDTRGANGTTAPGESCGEGCFDFYYGGSSGGDVRIERRASDGFTGVAVQVNGSILTTGGNGIGVPQGVVNSDGNHTGGGGGTISIDRCSDGCDLSGSIVVTGEIVASGGNGGTTNYPDADVNGGDGGGFFAFATGSITTAAITARGGVGGDGAEGPNLGGGENYGGRGGFVQADAQGPIIVGVIDVSGGAGGNAASFYGLGDGGFGGIGGSIDISGSSTVKTGALVAVGGAGGASATGGSGGDGGRGGDIEVFGAGNVQINVGGTLGALAIDVSGGRGGVGNPASSPAGDGGAGGNGGQATVAGTPEMTLFGSVLAGGGDGGAGGAAGGGFPAGTGGDGGAGGSIYLDASSVFDSRIGDGTIFVLAGTKFDVEGGFGGAGSGSPGAAGASNIFVQNPTGNSGYFGTIVILDPLSVPGINEGFQQIVEGGDDSTAFVGGEKEDEEEDKSQKELNSCKG
jgi:filamentous hemagglutinin family protein